MRTQTGFSLLETVIAMAISVLLLVMMEKMFLAQQTNLQHQLAWMTINNKFYFAREIITKAVRTAGFIGCRKLTKTFSDRYPMLLTPDNAIEVKTNTYLLVTRRYKPISRVKNDHKHYLIADCQHAEVTEVDQSLKYQYQSSAQFFVFEQNNFYLQKSSLYLQDESGKSDEVISGIDFIDVSLDKNILTIFLILNNDKNINAMPQSLDVNRQMHRFLDGKLHKLFQINIFLREQDG